MVKRKRVALTYAYNENWIGGTYYIENLIAALNQLPDAQKPELLIFSFDAADSERLKKAVQYPYWIFRRFERTLSLPARIANKLTATLLGRRFINTLYGDIDLIFPLPTAWRGYFSRVQHHLYWIPDFQEHYLPAFFKQEEILVRKTDQELILQIAKNIVFSSHAAQNDFNDIYPSNTLTQHVLQFAVIGKPASGAITDCLVKYDIAQPYFICSNQFWKHKNHAVVLRSLVKLRNTHPQTLIIFTGKEHDYRNPTYFEELMALCEDLGLRSELRFLGFIPREDQLILMQAAIAVIQPSLFEGWSTVVEDAKSLNVPIVASALSVHQEQLAEYQPKLFFPPDDDTKLAWCLIQMMSGEVSTSVYDYQHDVIRFAQEFMDIVERITTD
jgi:glycosyltransferase involved in cell wall biosynthesis